MKVKCRFAAILLTFAIFSSCAPSAEPTATVEPSAPSSPSAAVEPTATPEPNATSGPSTTPEPTSAPSPTPSDNWFYHLLPMTDEGSAEMSYDEYFAKPRYAGPWRSAPEDGCEITPETEKIFADYDIISPIRGNEIAQFFMTSDYKIYRLHVPSGRVDFMCEAAYDFEKGMEDYSYYIYTYSWEHFRNLRHYYNYLWTEGDEWLYSENIANDDATFEDWIKLDQTASLESWRSQAKEYMPSAGYFEVLSNNDVRFTVVGEWLPEYMRPTGNEWCSNVLSGSDWYCYGEYVTYSAALGKFGGRDEVLDLLNIPTEQRMTYTEFRDYYGGTPPHGYM